MNYKLLSLFTLACLLSFSLHAETDKPKPKEITTLITATPEQGRALAIRMVRQTIGTIQRDAVVKHQVRAQYAGNAQLLMYAAELVAIEFKTIAIANDYWR